MTNNKSIKILTTSAKLFATVAVVFIYFHYFSNQSWGFYTVEPNVPIYDVYQVKDCIAEKPSLLVSNFNDGIGISKKGRLLLDEIYFFVKKNAIKWKVYNKDSINIITHYEKYIALLPGKEPGLFSDSLLITKIYRPSYNELKSGKLFHPRQEYFLALISEKK